MAHIARIPTVAVVADLAEAGCCFVFIHISNPHTVTTSYRRLKHNFIAIKLAKYLS
jgi:hypothetical protein